LFFFGHFFDRADAVLRRANFNSLHCHLLEISASIVRRCFESMDGLPVFLFETQSA
jgi:hypothetical protein